MLGLIRLMWRLAWIGIFIMGLRKVKDLLNEGLDGIAQRIEEGDDSPLASSLERIHTALHEREAHEVQHAGEEAPAGLYGEG
jgi:hypothetical protein